MYTCKTALDEAIGQEKKNVEFPLTLPTLFYGLDPTDFIGKFVHTELKGQYKTVKQLTALEWGLQKCWSLNNINETLWKRMKINITTKVLME